MINCNPETVSTDFDIADKLYFEPVFWERVADVIDLEQPDGIILQLGGQTALKLARDIVAYGLPIFGTPFENMDLAEDRGKFSEILEELEIPFPPYGIAHTVEEAVDVAEGIGYPILIRPSYVLGGQGMRRQAVGWGNLQGLAPRAEAGFFPDQGRQCKTPRTGAGRVLGRKLWAYLPAGPIIITIWRPSILGMFSTLPMACTSSATRFNNSRPRFWWAISRPRNRKVIFTLSPPSRKRNTLRILTS